MSQTYEVTPQEQAQIDKGEFAIDASDFDSGLYLIHEMQLASPLNTPTRGHFIGWVMRDPDADPEYISSIADALVRAGRLTDEHCAACEARAASIK